MAEGVRRREEALFGKHGIRLAWRAWEARPAQAALVIVHGLGEHAGRYAEFGERLASSGISAFAFDLRGHGRSQGRRGDVQSFADYLHDVDRFRRHVEGLSDARLPLFLLGQSMGGLIALRYLQEYATLFRGAIICSPWLATAMPVPRWKTALAPLLARLLPALPLRHGLRAGDLTRDADLVEAYRADPLVHGIITPRTFAHVSSAMSRANQRGDCIQDPVLFLLGGDDHVVDTSRTLSFAASVTAPDVSVQLYPGHYHELLNELDRAQIHRRVRDWILARL